MTRNSTLRFSLLVGAVALATGIAACSGGGDDDDDAATTTGTPVCTPLPNTDFATIQSEIFTANCAFAASCHSTVSPQPVGAGANPLILTASSSLNETVNVMSSETFNGNHIPLIAPGNANGSYLYLKVTGATGITPVRMPSGSPPLCQVKIDAIRDWINDGANP